MLSSNKKEESKNCINICISSINTLILHFKIFYNVKSLSNGVMNVKVQTQVENSFSVNQMEDASISLIDILVKHELSSK